MHTRQPSAKPKIGLVLPGGGARAAYQVGVLRAIARFVPKDADGKRDDAHGMREFVVGTGGAKLTPLTLQRSGSAVSDNSTYGVLKLTLKQQGYEWEFMPVDAGGFKDHGAALCH